MQSGTIFGSQPYDLPLNETTTPQYLKSLGYTTQSQQIFIIKSKYPY